MNMLRELLIDKELYACVMNMLMKRNIEFEYGAETYIF